MEIGYSLLYYTLFSIMYSCLYHMLKCTYHLDQMCLYQQPIQCHLKSALKYQGSFQQSLLTSRKEVYALPSTEI